MPRRARVFVEGAAYHVYCRTARHERHSTMITTNLAFSEWVQVLGDEKLTTALLDRLASRGHILTTQGPSYRTRSRT